MNLHECRDHAERFHPAKTSFTLKTPAGAFAAHWLDPHMGLFQVPKIGECAVHVRDMRNCIHECTEITCTPQ
jgi:hypothetical protein